MDIRFDQNYITADDVLVSGIHWSPTVNVPAVINGQEIRRIGNGAFKGCVGVGTINIAEGIREIGSRAFENCGNLQTINLPQSVVKIEKDAFAGTALNRVTFWLRIPYKKYLSVREGSIKLTDGRYIFDPKTLGEEALSLVRSFRPDAVPEKFPVDPAMGYLYTDDHNGKEYAYIFDEYCRSRNIQPEDLFDEDDAMRQKIIHGDADIWFDHDEEADDRGDGQDINKTFTALLFCVEEGSISDSDIRLKFTLARNRYFFQRAEKVRWENRDYYFLYNEYLSSDKRYPFFRKFRSSRPYDANGHQWNAPEGLVQKLKLFRELV